MSKAFHRVLPRVCVGLIISVSLASECRADDEDSFQVFGNRFVGCVWTSTDPEGKRMEHVYQWTLGRRFVQFTDRTADAPALTLIGIDPANGKQTWWTFGADGRVGVVVGTEQETGPDTVSGSFESSDGTTKGTYTAKHIGRDRSEFTVEGQLDGKPVTGLQVWERKPDNTAPPKLASDPPAEIPAGVSVLAKLDKFTVGNYDSELGQGALSVVTNCILDGKFLRQSMSLVHDDQSTSSYQFILGVDSATGLATGWEFTSDGWVGKFVMADGKSLKGSIRTPMGEVTDYQGTFSFDGDGTLTYKATGKTGDAPPQPYGWVYRKLPGR